MMPNHVRIGWKFQGTLNPGICFALKHIFIYLPYFSCVGAFNVDIKGFFRGIEMETFD